MKIYRLEDDNHYGVYSTNKWFNHLSAEGRDLNAAFTDKFKYIFHDGSDRHPSPYRLDSESHRNFLRFTNDHNNYRYGFSSMQALEDWFTMDELVWLEENVGIRIATYEVPADCVHEFGKQVVFDVDAAELIS